GIRDVHVTGVQTCALPIWIFWAGGCASCHAAPGASGDDRKILGGGLELVSDFGTFIAPNISPSDQGIGGWTLQDFVNAMLKGVGIGRALCRGRGRAALLAR